MERIEIVLSDRDEIREIGESLSQADFSFRGIKTDLDHCFPLTVEECRQLAPLFMRPVRLTLVIEELPEEQATEQPAEGGAF